MIFGNIAWEHSSESEKYARRKSSAQARATEAVVVQLKSALHMNTNRWL